MIHFVPFEPGNTGTLEIAFWHYHAQHPQVYELFCTFVARAIDRGFRKYSSRTILEVMRWHTDVVRKGPRDYKINDHHIPYYARLWLREHPDFPGFFELRKLKVEKV